MILLDQVVVSGTSFVTNMLMARQLGLKAYGLFSFVFLVQLFLLSLQQAISTGVYQVLLNRLSFRKKVFYTSGLFYLQILFLLLVSVLGFVLYLWDTADYILPAIISVILFLFQDFLRKVLITNERADKALLTDVITNVLQILLIAISVFYNRLSLTNCFWITGLTFIPSIITGIYYLRPGSFRISSLQYAFHQHKHHSGWMLLSALLQWFAGNYFVMAAGWWLGFAALGALRLAQFIFGLLNVLLQAIENYALPKGVVLQHQPELLVKFLLSIFKKVSVLFLPILLLMSVFAEQILSMAGGKNYISYGYVMYGLSIVYLLIVVCLPVRIAIRIQLLNKHYFIGYVLATVFSISTAKILITTLGIAGVLTGLFLTQMILIIYWLCILKQKNVQLWKLSI